MIGVLVTLLVALAVLGSAVAARQQAQLAADLGAVAGAQALRSAAPAGEVCERAGAFVHENGADLQGCTVNASTAGGASEVLVEASVRLSLGPGWIARARARAGLIEP